MSVIIISNIQKVSGIWSISKCIYRNRKVT